MKYIWLKLFKNQNNQILRSCSYTVSGAKNGSDNFQSFYEKCHLETNNFQKTLLGVGSALLSLSDPKRGDMIAALGETTGLSALEYVKLKMYNSSEGKRILNEKPRVSTKTIDLNYLSNLKDDTVGKAYYKFLKKYNYTPDARLAVRFVDDVELAYVIQRYREVHDLFHAILNMPTNMLGEVTVKWIEAVQTRLPMCIGGAVFGAARLAPKFTRLYSTNHRPHLTQNQSTEEDEFLNSNRTCFMRIPCIELPTELLNAIEGILKDRNISDLTKNKRYMYNFLHSRCAPLSAEDLRTKKAECKAEVYSAFPFKNENASADEEEYYRKVVKFKVNNVLRSCVNNWKRLEFDDQTSYHYLVARASADYAVVMRVLYEIRQRDSSFAPKNIFDFGSGIGSVSWVAHSFWGNDIKEYFSVDCSQAMNDLARLVLQLNKPQKSPFITQLFQRQFLPATPRKYDLVVSAYSLIELDSMKSRAEVLFNLWAKTGQYLVIVEQGTNAGFKLINEARNLILHASEEQQESCHVFAPCPHEKTCLRFNSLPLTPCNFPVKYIDKIECSAQSKTELFSFVILKKGLRCKSDPQCSRVVRDVLHRHKHTICRICTMEGKLDEIILSKSKLRKDAYKLRRKISWGDLIPLEIDKTRI